MFTDMCSASRDTLSWCHVEELVFVQSRMLLFLQLMSHKENLTEFFVILK